MKGEVGVYVVVIMIDTLKGLTKDAFFGSCGKGWTM